MILVDKKLLHFELLLNPTQSFVFPSQKTKVMRTANWVTGTYAHVRHVARSTCHALDKSTAYDSKMMSLSGRNRQLCRVNRLLMWHSIVMLDNDDRDLI